MRNFFPQPLIVIHIYSIYYQRYFLMKLKIIGVIIFLQVLLLVSVKPLYADVKLARIFSSNMVLQQGRANPIWGWAEKGEKIVVTIAEKSVNVKAGSDGKWKAVLPILDYGGPYTVTVKGKNIIELTNVLIGEVWVCSGQSNMGWQLKLCNNGAKEVADAVYPNIRIFTVPKKISQFPLDDLESGEWEECSPQSIRYFSGVAYFFGRNIHQKLNVPVGLIHSSRGGTLAESWMSAESLEEDPDFKEDVAALRMADFNKIINERKSKVMGQFSGVLPMDSACENCLSSFSTVDYDDSKWADILVNKRWEANGYTNIDGVAWYRKSVLLTDQMIRSDLTLLLGRVDESDTTWMNGHRIGSTQNDSGTERIYTVPKETLKSGKNIILIRVEDKRDSGGLLGLSGGQRLETPEGIVDISGQWKIKFTWTKLNPIDINYYEYPTMLYNAMIHPITGFGIKGVIWYQGESNVSRASQYQRIFPNLITSWRKHWRQGNFPFLFVSLANYRQPQQVPGESDYAELREAQTKTLSLQNTAMAMAIDIGESGEGVHPPNKQDVGFRLALAALKTAYHQDVVSSGPMFTSMQVKGNDALIMFNNVGSGLLVKDLYGDINGFAIAGSDRKFYWAKAELVDDHTVRVYSPNVKNPVAARYAWADNPADINLYNREGLPANPFRTDSWPRNKQ